MWYTTTLLTNGYIYCTNMMIDTYDEDDKGMTYEEVLEFLEEELYETITDESPYKPLNFHETDECFEE